MVDDTGLSDGVLFVPRTLASQLLAWIMSGYDGFAGYSLEPAPRSCIERTPICYPRLRTRYVIQYHSGRKRHGSGTTLDAIV